MEVSSWQILKDRDGHQIVFFFLVIHRNRLLAVLSSDDGVDAVDDLDETETLIRHFEERKRKIAEVKMKGKATLFTCFLICYLIANSQ